MANAPRAPSLVPMESRNALVEPIAPSHAPSRPLRLLVGYDGQPASRDALALAKALTETGETELTAAAVRAYLPERLGESLATVLAEDERWVSRGTTAALGNMPFSVRVLTGGREAEGLEELAEAEESDMIIVGSTHRGQVGRVCPGGVGEHLLTALPCPVAIAPRGLADQSFHLGSIAVALNGTLESESALRIGTDLAKRTGASLWILALSDVDHAISDAVAAADLLVIGAHRGSRSAHGLLPGSAAARLVRTGPCPILIAT